MDLVQQFPNAPLVHVNGVRLHHRLEGPPGRPVVMLCHGLLGTLHMWAPQMRALTRRYRVLRFDNRGHGLSGVGDAPYSVELLARDSLALLDALHIERVHFVGCSLGGMIGQRLAAENAGRLASLVLAGTLAVMPPASMWDERVRIAREHGIAALLPVMLERWFTPAFRARNTRAVAAVARGVLHTPPEGFVGACLAIKTMDQRALLPAIQVPALVAGADCDPGVPLASTRAIQAAIPGAELQVVRRARHLFSIERPRLFTTLLLDWLARH